MTLIDKIKNLTWFNLVELLQDILSNFNKKIEVLEESSNDVFIGINTPVSATQSGIVNNTSLQELGGVDKLINGVRAGRGSGTNAKATVLGEGALGVITTGVSNTAIGYLSQSLSTTGFQNVSIGNNTLQNNIGGSSMCAIGNNALTSNTSGYENNAVGSNALRANTTGIYNNAFGQQALNNNIIGSRNSAFGHRPLNSALGDDNIAIGYLAGIAITSGSRNVIISNNATGTTTGLTTGNDNLIVSQNLGNTTGITTGSGNTIIGKVTGLTAALANTVIVSDGVGTQRFVSNSTNLSTLPAQTTALITADGTGKSILTKEYLGSRIGTVAPASATDTGTVGEIRVAAGFIYWCTAPNTWIRAAGVTW